MEKSDDAWERGRGTTKTKVNYSRNRSVNPSLASQDVKDPAVRI